MSHTDVTLDQLRWPQVQVTCWPDGSALDGVDRNRSRSTNEPDSGQSRPHGEQGNRPHRKLCEATYRPGQLAR